MNKNKKSIFSYSFILLAVVIVSLLVISNGTSVKNTNINPPKIIDFFSFHKDLDLKDVSFYLSIDIEDEGYDVYTTNGRGYRYGPSIIKYEDGTMDAWFAANGSGNEWDWISYRHFDGSEWSEEEIVLKPTKKSLDHYSVCDPGVIYFNGYYYLGYTSTTNATGGGVENDCFVARSTSPNGPFEKWNGDGWGGKPRPFIEYTEDDGQWGTGEISFVIVEDKLYCYYSWISLDGSYTKLALADLQDNWPANIEDKDIVIRKVSGQDSVDVAFNEKYHKFLAFCIEDRFMSSSCIAVYESDDGTDFKQVDRVGDINKYAHNMGISKSVEGHINMDEDLYVGYAYGKSSLTSWGKWSAKIQKVKLNPISN